LMLELAVIVIVGLAGYAVMAGSFFCLVGYADDAQRPAEHVLAVCGAVLWLVVFLWMVSLIAVLFADVPDAHVDPTMREAPRETGVPDAHADPTIKAIADKQSAALRRAQEKKIDELVRREVEGTSARSSSRSFLRSDPISNPMSSPMSRLQRPGRGLGRR
jgi:hypothetical protein